MLKRSDKGDTEVTDFNKIDLDGIYATFQGGGIAVEVKEAHKLGDVLLKNIVSMNKKFNPKERKKDYKFALAKMKIRGNNYMVTLIQTPEGGYITQRWFDVQSKQMFVPKNIYVGVGDKQGNCEVRHVMGFADGSNPPPEPIGDEFTIHSFDSNGNELTTTQ